MDIRLITAKCDELRRMKTSLKNVKTELDFPESCGLYPRSHLFLSSFQRYDAQLILPKVLFSLSTASILDGRKELTNITFIAYKTSNMFPDSDLTGVESKTENTTINSVIIGVHMQG